jgi:hypothetical protein
MVMADEKIEVEWIATAKQMLDVIQKVDQRMEKLEKTQQSLANASKKGADLAAGSYNKLEQQMKEAEAALKGMTQGTAEFAAQRSKVDALKKSLSEAKDELSAVRESPWPAIGRGMAVATGAALALYMALQKVGQAQREIVSRGADQAVGLDTMARKMQIQAGLTDPERQEMSRQIIEQASGAGVKAEVGFQAATQLAGSGFTDAVDSGTLKTILDTIQASSFQGSPDELVSAFAESLNAYGLEKTNQNLQQIAVAAQSLFKQTDFQLTELQDFAKNASVFEGANIKIDEALAGFTALREVLPAAESGTGLRNFVNKLQAGDLTKENKDNLARIGVDAEQVDFVGESLVQVIQTIRDATQKMPEADRNAALGKMFGTENVASARLLLESGNRIQELQKSQADPAQFMKDRDTAATGMQAGRNRLENEALLNSTLVGEKLNEIDQRNKKFDNDIEAIKQKAAAMDIPLVGAAAAASGAMVTTANDAVGGEFVGNVNEGLFQVFQSFFRSSEDVQKQQLEETKKLREAVERQPQQNPNKVAAPNVRPKEAPLPAATAP